MPSHSNFGREYFLRVQVAQFSASDNLEPAAFSVVLSVILGVYHGRLRERIAPADK